ncbi:M23 family metallopeptidase [Luteipulveratus flavus]|uniref:M23 family metallopeptidase n=1 Tax=Luteipulveratus flavus TaxID=3031728 RepID=A0ABT6C4L9_9MICO|nr:M23 family metallopeptidase [Luteipulveratus sp. YIM 133296]MDF8263825.1 M23 family metallopeptidase [Luteipulveratus sp. YIM 133296]
MASFDWSTLLAAGVAAAGLGGTTDSAPAPAHGYVWPLSPPPAVVRRFEPPPKPWLPGHRGVDLEGGAGSVVLAAGSGRVVFSGVVAGRGVVSVEHAGGWRTTYEPLIDRVARGTAVGAGTTIGRLDTAASHCAPATCLHWGLVTGPDEYRDPLLLLGARRPVLLPVG